MKLFDRSKKFYDQEEIHNYVQDIHLTQVQRDKAMTHGKMEEVEQFDYNIAIMNEVVTFMLETNRTAQVNQKPRVAS
jgi:hypothetical protein